MLEYFGDEGQSLFGVVTTKVIDLSDDRTKGRREEFIEEERSIVSIGLPEIGWMKREVLRV